MSQFGFGTIHSSGLFLPADSGHELLARGVRTGQYSEYIINYLCGNQYTRSRIRMKMP